MQQKESPKRTGKDILMAQKRNSKSKSLQEKKRYFVITKDQFFIKL